MYNLWMSSSLEYLPLFIFVLTLTYKKKERGEKNNKKQKTHPTTKRTSGCWRKDGHPARLSQGCGEGVGLVLGRTAPPPPPLMPRELFPFVCQYTAHWDQEFPAQNSVLLWTHPMHPLAPFKYYVIMLQKASSLDQKDTRRSSLILWGFHDDSTPIKGKKDKKNNNKKHPHPCLQKIN